MQVHTSMPIALPCSTLLSNARFAALCRGSCTQSPSIFTLARTET